MVAPPVHELSAVERSRRLVASMLEKTCTVISFSSAPSVLCM